MLIVVQKIHLIGLHINKKLYFLDKNLNKEKSKNIDNFNLNYIEKLNFLQSYENQFLV